MSFGFNFFDLFVFECVRSRFECTLLSGSNIKRRKCVSSRNILLLLFMIYWHNFIADKYLCVYRFADVVVFYFKTMQNSRNLKIWKHRVVWLHCLFIFFLVFNLFSVLQFFTTNTRANRFGFSFSRLDSFLFSFFLHYFVCSIIY